MEREPVGKRGVTTVGIRELKAQASSIIERAAAGHPVLVSRRGIPIAVLLPFDVDVEGMVDSRLSELRDQRRQMREEIKRDGALDAEQAAIWVEEHEHASVRDARSDNGMRDFITWNRSVADSLSADKSRRRLEEAVRAFRDNPRGDEIIRDALGEAEVLCLGEPAGHVAENAGTESELLHFTVDLEGSEQTLLPIFTRPEAIGIALRISPEWADLQVLQVNGAELEQSVGADVRVVINPWSPLELLLPRRGGHTLNAKLLSMSHDDVRTGPFLDLGIEADPVRQPVRAAALAATT
jgi:prevent-host-death family protein